MGLMLSRGKFVLLNLTRQRGVDFESTMHLGVEKDKT